MFHCKPFLDNHLCAFSSAKTAIHSGSRLTEESGPVADVVKTDAGMTLEGPAAASLAKIRRQSASPRAPVSSERQHVASEPN